VSTPTRRLLIDTDPGVDDSMMIQLALVSPEIRVDALTTVFGNSDVATTTRNALTNLEVAGREDIPVARGAGTPLTRPAPVRYPVHVHGADGLGNANRPAPRGAAIATPAAAFIVERVMTATPGELTVLAVGPLTNLALALRLEPAIAARVREIVMMGGTTGRGNVSPTAESNVHHDPEAARIVFHGGWPVTMVGLDVTMPTLMTAAHLAEIREARTPAADLIGAITPF
jgi:purine nucleosidase